MKSPFKIPLQSEVEKYIKEKMNWPDKFITYYANKFWNHYQASGWKLSSGNSIKDWKACFNSQWQTPKFKEDIEMLNGSKLNNFIEKEIAIAEIKDLDAFLQKYTSRPTEVPFKDFGPWYEYMKAERLLKPLTLSEIAELRRIYKNDNMKCRCACVQMTMDGYVTSGFTFQKVMELRMKLA